MIIKYKISEERKKLPLRFRNLNAIEKSTMLNGCGAKGSFIDPPEYIFTASCCQHDLNYMLGPDETARKKADDQFLGAMLADAASASNWFLRAWYKGAAYRYYWAVRIFGRFHFHYRERELTWDEFERMMNEELNFK